MYILAGVWSDLAFGRDALPVASTAGLVFATDCKHAGELYTTC